MNKISENIQYSSQRPKNDYPFYQVIDAALRYGLRVLPARPWTERVALWWGYQFRPEACAAKLRSGASIYVNPTDYLQLLIYYLGTFEPHCLPYLRGCTTKGGTVVDVGANIGFYTLESSSSVGPTGRVIAIEAAPPHVNALRKNIQLNGMSNVSIIEVAVADTVGTATLALPGGDNLGMYTLGSVDGDESYSVALRPMDDLLAEQSVHSLDLIKMDIEGSEYRALRGAAKTLERFKPALLIELNEPALHRCASSAREVKELLSEAGYQGWVIGRGDVRSIPEGLVTHHCDECLFIHRDRQALMRELRLP